MMKQTLILAVVVLLTVLISITAFAQGTAPTSGALLTINGTVGSVAVNRNIYDSQIHTGTVILTGTCDTVYHTDAYVLQGGSPTGCDNGDDFETSQGTGTATISGAGYSFTITTQYLMNGEQIYCTSTGVTPQICANPDTGFLTVTNNSGTPFSGTIALSGTAVNPNEYPNSGYCRNDNNGVASTTFSNGLADKASVILALSTDSSNCGGWNADQTVTVTAGQTTKFQFGNDAYEITPFNSATGDQVTVRPVPVPQVNFSLGSGNPFSGEQCIPYADTSTGTTQNPFPVCVEIQVTCPNCADQFLYQAQADYTIDPISLPGGIGGPAFLGRHGETCPPSVFDLNIFDSYSLDPTKGSGSGVGSCYVATYKPGAPAVQSAQQQTFVGFQSPVVDGQLNQVKAGRTVPLIWQTLDYAGNPVTNLNLCTQLNGTGCTAPWVVVANAGVNCSNDQINTSTLTDDGSSGNSALQNLGGGTYQFNWQTQKGSTGCVTPVLIFSTGYVSFDVAEFQYK
jgi:hypothetical protein